MSENSVAKALFTLAKVAHDTVLWGWNEKEKLPQVKEAGHLLMGAQTYDTELHRVNSFRMEDGDRVYRVQVTEVKP